MPTRLVSVLVNNHNYGQFVPQAVASALAQTGVDAEVIVVDDGSTDRSRPVLEEYRGRIEIVLQDNLGQAAAINAGVGASRGEILCFLDADDWWAPNKLASVVQAFRADPRASLVYHRLQPVLIDGEPALKPIPRSLCAGDLSRRLSRSAGWWPFPMRSAVAVRRSAWRAAGDIPEHFRISADAWLTGVYPFIGRVAALPESLGYYRLHANNWYREADDAAMLAKRIAHWHKSVEATNRFLAGHALPARLRMADHYPCRVAAARLAGAGLRTRLCLALEGLRFAGEPNPLRRARDALRTALELPGVERRAGLPEAVE